MFLWAVLCCCQYFGYVKLNGRMTDEPERIVKGNGHGIIKYYFNLFPYRD
jgi:hypothetical protein